MVSANSLNLVTVVTLSTFGDGLSWMGGTGDEGRGKGRVSGINDIAESFLGHWAVGTLGHVASMPSE